MAAITYRLLRADEADDLVAFVSSIYGASHPSDLFCDASAIRSAIEAETLFCGVGVNEAGRIVGHLATLLDRPGDVTGDGITGMVSPDVRGQQVLNQLARPLLEVHAERGIVGLHIYPVTVHDISQRRVADNGGAVTGLLLWDWPANISMTGFSTDALGDRTSMVMMYFPFGQVPKRIVHLPDVYAEMLRSIFDSLSLLDGQRVLERTRSSVDAGVSRVEAVAKRRQGTATLRFHQIAGDWSDRLDEWALRHDSSPALYVDVPLSSACLDPVIGSLRERGWFFGGLLLERAGTDFLRMQRGGALPSRSTVQLCPSAERMWDFVLADALAVRSDSPQ